MPAKSVPRVLGPYRNRDKYRLVVVDGRARKSVVCGSVQEATALRAELAGALRSETRLTIGAALAEFQTFLYRGRGIRPATAEHTCRQLARFLPDQSAVPAVSSADAARLYEKETQRITGQFGRAVAVATHRSLLRRTKQFFQWTVEQGFASTNPFAAVKPVGRVRVGKPQLRIDEARRFLACAQELLAQGDLSALGCLLMLLLGLRSGEVLGLRVRDIDDGATVLWIARGKTKNARRRLQLPAILLAPLRERLKNRAPHELLFGENRRGGPRPGVYLWEAVQRVCARACVPQVCAHSLRGLHSTLALEAGATSDVVAAALGHASFAITARHYADPDTLVNTKTRRVALALDDRSGAGLAASPSGTDLTALVAELSDAQRAELQQLLATPKRPARAR